MSDPRNTYTYRDGERIELTKSTDSFMVATPVDYVIEHGFGRVEAAAPSVTRVTVQADLIYWRSP